MHFQCIVVEFILQGKMKKKELLRELLSDFTTRDLINMRLKELLGFQRLI